MIKKFTMCIKNLFKQLSALGQWSTLVENCFYDYCYLQLIEELEYRIPGYLAHCEDCGHIKRVTFLKDTQRFLCRDCINRYVKLYINMNKIESDQEKIRQIGQVV